MKAETNYDPPECNLSTVDVKNHILEKRFTTRKNQTGRSPIWSAFEAVLDENGEQIGFVYCTWCNKVLTKNKKSSSNLLSHPCVKKASVETTVKVSEELQQTIASACVHWTITSGVPFTTLASVGIHKLLGEILKVGAAYGPTLNASDLLPQPATVASALTELYNEHFPQIRDELTAIKYSAITTDILNDHLKRLSCITVTMHYMQNRVLLERILSVEHFELDSVTDECAWLTIRQTLDKFAIKLEHTIFMTDPGSNISTSFPSCTRLFCATHLIESVLISATDRSAAFFKLCAKINGLVYFIKSSTNAQLRSTLESKYDSQRNSKLQMFNAIKNNWNNISRKLKEQNELKKLDGIQVAHVAEVVAFLTHFDNALNDLQVSNRSTLHLCLPLYEQLRKQCIVEKADSNLMMDLKQNCGKFLLEIWKPKITMHHLAATFIFPPCKKLLVLPADERSMVHAFVENEYTKMSNPDPPPLIIAKVETINEPTSPQPQNIFAAFQEPGDFIKSGKSFSAEVMRYLDEPLEEFDVDYMYTYWQSRKNLFPRLYEVSQMLSVVPASNGASGRAYALARNLMNNDVPTDCYSLNNMLVLNSHFKILENQ